jgi:hypothetical protein
MHPMVALASGLLVTLVIAAAFLLIVAGFFMLGRSKVGGIALIILGLLVGPAGLSIWQLFK